MFSPRPQPPVTKTTSRKSRFGVERKHHAARCLVRAHHLHDADRKADLQVIEAVLVAIDDGTVGEHRGEALPAGLEQIVQATHIEEALMLPGEACGGQILRRGRTAHGHGHSCTVLALQATVVFGKQRLHPVGAGGGMDDRPGLGRRGGQPGDIVAAHALQQRLQARPGIRRRQGVAVEAGRQGKSVGDLHALGRQGGIHLAQRGVLAADRGDVAGSDVLEPTRIVRRDHGNSPAYVPIPTEAGKARRWFLTRLTPSTFSAATR